MSDLPEGIKEPKPEEEIPAVSRFQQILRQADDAEAVKNAWECMVEFHRIAKVFDSPFTNRALAAAAYMNKLRSAVDIPCEIRESPGSSIR